MGLKVTAFSCFSLLLSNCASIYYWIFEDIISFYPAFVSSLDRTRIVSRPQDAEVVSGTTAQLICQAEYDKSLQDSFELVWRKDGGDIPLSVEENSRLVGRFPRRRGRVCLCSVYSSLCSGSVQ